MDNYIYDWLIGKSKYQITHIIFLQIVPDIRAFKIEPDSGHCLSLDQYPIFIKK